MTVTFVIIYSKQCFPFEYLELQLISDMLKLNFFTDLPPSCHCDL